VSNDALADLLVWAYKQGFLDAAQILTEAVKSLDETKIRAQLLAGLEELSKPSAPDKPKASEGADADDCPCREAAAPCRSARFLAGQGQILALPPGPSAAESCEAMSNEASPLREAAVNKGSNRTFA